MSDRSRRGPALDMPRAGNPPEVARREPAPSSREPSTPDRSRPPIEPTQPSDPTPSAAPVPPQAEQGTGSLSQVLNELIRGLPSRSDHAPIERAPVADRVAGNISPPPELRDTPRQARTDQEASLTAESPLPSSDWQREESTRDTYLHSSDRSQAPIRTLADRSGIVDRGSVDPGANQTGSQPSTGPVAMPIESHSVTPSSPERSEPVIGHPGPILRPDLLTRADTRAVVRDGPSAEARTTVEGPRSAVSAPTLSDSSGGIGSRVTAAGEGWGSSPSLRSPSGEASGVPTSIGINLRHVGNADPSIDQKAVQNLADPSLDASASRNRASASDETQGGADMGRTNALLEQILDELRKSPQSSFVASGRSIYPER